MSGINKVILIGNLGKDPELRNFEGGKVVANFTLATTEVYRDKDQNKIEHTEWHNISMWGKLAEIASKFLRKGSKVYIEGRIKTRSWEDKDGNKKYTTEIVGENFTMLDKRTSTGDDALQHETGASSANNDMPMADDLPF